MHWHLPVIPPEAEGVYQSHDTFIGQSVAEGTSSRNMVPSEYTFVSVLITNQHSSNDGNPDRTLRQTLNEVSDRRSTSHQAIASLTNLSLDSDPRTAAPSILSTVEDDLGRYKGLAEAAEKLTNTLLRPDERLSHVAAASQCHRVKLRGREPGELEDHAPYLLAQRKAYLGKRYKARLALALEPAPAPNSELDEIELGAMSGNHDQKLAPSNTGRNTTLQRCIAVMMDRLMGRSCAWFLLGFWAVLILSAAVPM